MKFILVILPSDRFCLLFPFFHHPFLFWSTVCMWNILVLDFLSPLHNRARQHVCTSHVSSCKFISLVTSKTLQIYDHQQGSVLSQLFSGRS